MGDLKITKPSRPAPGGIDPKADHTNWPHENLSGNGGNHWDIPHQNFNTKEAAGRTIKVSLKGSLDKASVDKLAALGAKVQNGTIEVAANKIEAAKKIVMGR